MTRYLRETWDLHAGALVAFWCLGMILLWCGVISAWAVLVVAVLGAILSVLAGLWVLALFGVTLPW